ncbi:hypothetical protein HRG_006084 [Hirsutella rhossiliensis]|uniref:Uncharacterized protein n=1 Tax=Hirsutella rhossiliensis TaxID=111463 RepID=A0A9P8SIV2_9HYPO|nr:uncharacterized protein HRG_06084 [Hirsutella rhossiliensis]KAH0963574.1 hypothetical protein HRG_06084 [Hirsutella rhossiliensis]
MFQPNNLRLLQSIRYPTTVHTNLNLHHAAIGMQEKHSLPESVKRSSVCRLRTSAEKIVSIVKIRSQSTALESRGRHFEMTYNFLQQACLGIEGNGLDACLKVLSLSKYRASSSDAKCSIPLLPIVRIVTRNLTPKRADHASHKRKQVSTTPEPDAARDTAPLDAVMGEELSWGVTAGGQRMDRVTAQPVPGFAGTPEAENEMVWALLAEMVGWHGGVVKGE